LLRLWRVYTIPARMQVITPSALNGLIVPDEAQ
jgi:hypothetical protein